LVRAMWGRAISRTASLWGRLQRPEPCAGEVSPASWAHSDRFAGAAVCAPSAEVLSAIAVSSPNHSRPAMPEYSWLRSAELSMWSCWHLISARLAAAGLRVGCPGRTEKYPPTKPPALWVARGRTIMRTLIYKKKGAQFASLQRLDKTRPPEQTVPGRMFYNNE
jgi:hypothetical protein